MAKGSLRNVDCPHGHKTKYKKCCWDKDYWEFFSRLVTKKIDKKTKEETEVVKYIRH